MIIYCLFYVQKLLAGWKWQLGYTVKTNKKKKHMLDLSPLKSIKKKNTTPYHCLTYQSTDRFLF